MRAIDLRYDIARGVRSKMVLAIGLSLRSKNVVALSGNSSVFACPVISAIKCPDSLGVDAAGADFELLVADRGRLDREIARNGGVTVDESAEIVDCADGTAIVRRARLELIGERRSFAAFAANRRSVS